MFQCIVYHDKQKVTNLPTAFLAKLCNSQDSGTALNIYIKEMLATLVAASNHRGVEAEINATG